MLITEGADEVVMQEEATTLERTVDSNAASNFHSYSKGSKQLVAGGVSMSQPNITSPKNRNASIRSSSKTAVSRAEQPTLSLN